MVMRLLLKRLKITFIAHYTLYTFIASHATNTTMYKDKILSSKKSSFFQFFSFLRICLAGRANNDPWIPPKNRTQITGSTGSAGFFPLLLSRKKKSL